MAPGIYLTRLDGSEKRLLVQLDDLSVFSPLFGLDNRWLTISVRNTDLPNSPITPALVNVATCQGIPLRNLNGEIRGWVK